MKTLIRLRGGAGWFESQLGVHVRRYAFSRCGSYSCSNTPQGGGGKFFPFRVEPFFIRICTGKQTEVHKTYFLCEEKNGFEYASGSISRKSPFWMRPKSARLVHLRRPVRILTDRCHPFGKGLEKRRIWAERWISSMILVCEFSCLDKLTFFALRLYYIKYDSYFFLSTEA